MNRLLMMLLGAIILITPTTSFAGDCGDVNDDSSINIFDITHLISYLYLEGPEPDCGPLTGTVTDIDGNVYQTVRIGNQWWMAENLSVTHYRNGDPIPNVTDDGAWGALSTGAYCEFNNDIANVATYGRLYNWFTVDDSRSMCPECWRVPTDDDWQQLEVYLGMSQSVADQTLWRGTDEGGKLKEEGTAHWVNPNTGATNESGFSALPGGRRSSGGSFANMTLSAYFWTSTGASSDYAWFRELNYYHADVYRNVHRVEMGMSVRCVRD